MELWVENQTLTTYLSPSCEFPQPYKEKKGTGWILLLAVPWLIVSQTLLLGGKKKGKFGQD